MIKYDLNHATPRLDVLIIDAATQSDSLGINHRGDIMKNILFRLLKQFPAIGSATLLVPFLASAPALADSGFYVGASAGSAQTELEFADVGLGSIDFDEDDTAWKILGGFNFDILVVDLAVEAAWVDFGSPSNSGLEVDVDGISGFGLVGFELGPIGVFGKAGLVSWDAEATLDNLVSDDDSGTDPAYGIGARFSIGSIELRAEYEIFDIDADGVNSSDLSMVSVGGVWTF
jgi:outer membrane immunogenic protein